MEDVFAKARFFDVKRSYVNCKCDILAIISSSSTLENCYSPRSGTLPNTWCSVSAQDVSDTNVLEQNVMQLHV
jgi:hypothetical protein